MIIKTLVEEDFINFKLPCMYIGTAYCNGKCCKEAGIPLSVCHNDAWRKAATIDIGNRDMIERYISNNITHAICFAGLEPLEQFDDVLNIVSLLRDEYHCHDTVVIYTGFNKNEILSQIYSLKQFDNIIIKFGRYIPNHTRHYDETLGVYLASDNQYAEKIS